VQGKRPPKGEGPDLVEIERASDQGEDKPSANRHRMEEGAKRQCVPGKTQRLPARGMEMTKEGVLLSRCWFGGPRLSRSRLHIVLLGTKSISGKAGKIFEAGQELPKKARRRAMLDPRLGHGLDAMAGQGNPRSRQQIDQRH